MFQNWVMFYVLCLIFWVLHFTTGQNRYIIYDVTQHEGFNLRRDVYIRIINFVRLFNNSKQWSVVLPPWHKVYHWRSSNDISWSNLFDIKSFNIVHKVVEYKDLYIKSNSKFEVDLAIVLKNHPSMNDGDFSPRADIVQCTKDEVKYQIFNLFTVKETICINIRMDIFEFSKFFQTFIQDKNHLNSFYIHDAEKLIHGVFSEWSEEYWTVRRSMIFSKRLKLFADEFRKKMLNSTDIDDKSVMPDDWRIYPWPLSPAFGGPYIGAHLRRADFIWGREKSSPTIDEVVNDLSTLCLKYRLNNVFLATDATEAEKVEIKKKSNVINITVFYFDPRNSFHDAEVAIIDQLIASHGRAFIGTFQSTFTFRIFEERQIMGFHPSTTHSYFCPRRLHNDDEDADSCSRPTSWPVKLELAYTKSPIGIKTEL